MTDIIFYFEAHFETIRGFQICERNKNQSNHDESHIHVRLHGIGP